MPATTQLRIFAAAARSVLAQADYYRLHESQALSERWLASVSNTFLQLLHLPESRPRVSLAAYRGTELPIDLRRSLVIGFPEHLIFYRYSPSDGFVKILDVTDGRRELDSVLEEMLMDE